MNNLLIDNAYYIKASLGDDPIEYIADPGGPATIEDVLRLKAACESHLREFTDADEIEDARACRAGARAGDTVIFTRAEK